MAAPTHYYHRINSNSAERYRDAQVRDFNADATDTEAHVQSLLTHRTPLSTGRWDHGDESISVKCGWFNMHCTDGVRRDIKAWFHEENGLKSLIPNHRANAMIDAGRFETAERTEMSDNFNQILKDYKGCNFVFGDLVCEIPTGTPVPDHSIYGNNPLWYIMQPRKPPAELIEKLGQEMAVNKLSPTRKYDIIATGDTGTPVWQDATYYAVPRVCGDIEFKTLLQLWGVPRDELTRFFPALKEPREYATILQYTRQWSRLDLTDKDDIWRLMHRPKTANSACYTQQGTVISDDETFEMVFSNKPQTPERQDFIQLMKSWEDPPTVTQSYSLHQLEDSITSTYPRDPALIYFHHDQSIFMYMLGREAEDNDEGDYREELRNLRRGLREGRILSIVEGEPLLVGGRELFTMEVEFRNRECHPYFLLRRDGNMAHAAKTPYFFLVHQTGANAIRWINGRH